MGEEDSSIFQGQQLVYDEDVLLLNLCQELEVEQLVVFVLQNRGISKDESMRSARTRKGNIKKKILGS